MKKLLVILLTSICVSAKAQNLSIDGITGSVIAPTYRQYLPFVDDSVNTRIRHKYNINSAATVAVVDYWYEYQSYVDSNTYTWQTLKHGTFTVPLSFDTLKINLMRITRDSFLQNVDFKND